MGRIKDLSGQTFGNFTITQYHGLNDHGRALWEAKCSCGATIVARGDVLQKKMVRCPECAPPLFPSKLGRPRKSGFSAEEVTIRSILHGIKSQAKKRGYAYTLSLEKAAGLIQENCFFCGALPQNYRNTRQGVIFYWQGLDRLDNDEGYTEENTVPCCRRCNVAKNDQSFDEFVEHIDKIYHHLGIDKSKG